MSTSHLVGVDPDEVAQFVAMLRSNIVHRDIVAKMLDELIGRASPAIDAAAAKAIYQQLRLRGEHNHGLHRPAHCHVCVALAAYESAIKKPGS